MASRTVSIVLTGTNASAVKAIAGVETAAAKAGAGAESKLGKSAGKIGVAFHALDQQLSAFGVPFAGTFGLIGSTLEHAENKTKSFGNTLSKIGQVELAAAVISVAAIGSEAVHLADDLEQAHAREETAIKNAGGSYEQYATRIGKAESMMEKFGFTNAETDSSLANLTNATHDAGKAIDLQSLAADIARGRHIGLAEATNILMKVETGHVALLGRLGINIKDANGKIISQEEAIRRLAATYKGQAAAAADTFAGKMKTLSTTVQDVGAKLGESIVPKIEAVASAVSSGITEFESLNSTLDGVPGKVLAGAAAFPALFFAGSKVVDGLKAVGGTVGEAVGRFGRFTGVMGEVAAAEDAATAATVGNTEATAANSAAKGSRIALTTEEVAAANAGAVATLDQEAAYAGLTGSLDSATIATHQLTEADMEQIAVWAALTGEEEAAAVGLAAFQTVEEETIATTGAMSAVFGTVGGALTALTGGFILGKIAGDKINDMLNGTKPNVDELTTSLEKAAATGQISGAAAAAFGGDLGKLAGDLDKVNGGIHIFGSKNWSLSPSVHQARKDIDAANESLEAILKTQGVSAAGSAFQLVKDQLIALGVPVATIYEQFNPFLHRLGEELPTAARTAASAVADLRSEFSTFAEGLGRVESGLKIADSIDAIGTAAQKVAADKADIAGTSKTAQDANRAEADANRGLADSYDGLANAQAGVTTAAHSLFEAQQALEQFNSPRGVQERALQVDIIRRRVVTTAAESDQKQLDLMQFDDTNASKKQQLQDAVIAGQKGLADAEKGVVTATRNVADAQRNVQDAVLRRKAVHDDAAKAIQGDERKVQEAVINSIQLIGTAASKQEVTNAQVKTWAGYLDAVAKIYAPGSSLSKNIDTFYSTLIANQQKANLPAGTLGPAGPQGKTPATGSQGPAAPQGPLGAFTPQQALAVPFLHALGVPGFEKGGDVPGPEGKPLVAVVHGGEKVLTVAQAKVQPTQPNVQQVAVPQAVSATTYSTPTPMAASVTPNAKAPLPARTTTAAPAPSAIRPTPTTAAVIPSKTAVYPIPAARPSSRAAPATPDRRDRVAAAPPARTTIPLRPPLLPAHNTTTTVHHVIDARQEINFHGTDTPTLAELDMLNREQGWRLARTGRY